MSSSAVQGQKGEPAIRGRGTCKIFCLNCMVLDQRTLITAPELLRNTSDLQRCLAGSNLSIAGISKLDFLKKVKNPTKHTAQKVKAAYSVTFDLLILELMFLFFKNTVKKLKFRYTFYRFRKS